MPHPTSSCAVDTLCLFRAGIQETQGEGQLEGKEPDGLSVESTESEGHLLRHMNYIRAVLQSRSNTNTQE